MYNEIKYVKVKDYVEKYNKTNKNKITRNDVYKMIREGILEATKNPLGHWLIRVDNDSYIELTIKEFINIYNKKFKKDPITANKLRELASTNKIKAKKSKGKWIILTDPNKKIKY